MDIHVKYALLSLDEDKLYNGAEFVNDLAQFSGDFLVDIEAWRHAHLFESELELFAFLKINMASFVSVGLKYWSTKMIIQPEYINELVSQ